MQHILPQISIKLMKQQGEVRIISGKWRSRKLRFPALPGLRPTTDQVRETLFNWLDPDIVGAHCLDLFAGSGALGIEALSRGAAYVAFVDRNPQLVRYLKDQLSQLEASNANVYQAEIPVVHLFDNSVHPFDIIFLDPPFAQNLIEPCCQWLEQQNWLAPQALIYLETEAKLTPLPLPPTWQLLRSKTTKHVSYNLAQRNATLP